MEQVHRGEVVLVLVEVLDGVDLGWEEWVAPEQVQDPVENASALNAVWQFPMKPEFPVSTRSAQNAGQKW
jgi:hypothetical protein